jgi:hypothetical protein
MSARRPYPCTGLRSRRSPPLALTLPPKLVLPDVLVTDDALRDGTGAELPVALCAALRAGMVPSGSATGHER